MENIKNNVSRTIENISNTPLSNMIKDKTLYSDAHINISRMRLIKRVAIFFLIIIILSLYGLNIFNYLAEGTDIITAIVSPFTYIVALTTGDTMKTTIENVSQGGQKIITEMSNFIQVMLQFISDLLNNSLMTAGTTSISAIDKLQSNIVKERISAEKGAKNLEEKGEIKEQDSTINNKQVEEQEEEQVEEQSPVLKNERKIETRTREVSKETRNNIVEKENKEPAPLQTSYGDQGYCYIGNQNDVRYCAKVSSRNKCMSGDIFPTIDICINPNLRK